VAHAVAWGSLAAQDESLEVAHAVAWARAPPRGAGSSAAAPCRVRRRARRRRAIQRGARGSPGPASTASGLGRAAEPGATGATPAGGGGGSEAGVPGVPGVPGVAGMAGVARGWTGADRRAATGGNYDGDNREADGLRAVARQRARRVEPVRP